MWNLNSLGCFVVVNESFFRFCLAFWKIKKNLEENSIKCLLPDLSLPWICEEAKRNEFSFSFGLKCLSNFSSMKNHDSEL